MKRFDQAAVPIVTEFMVKAPYDMHLCASIFYRFLPTSQNLLVGHHIPFGIAKVGAKGAEPAAVDANVGRIEVGVDVVVSDVAIDPLAYHVRQLADFVQANLWGIEKNPLVEIQASPLFDFLTNRVESVAGSRSHDCSLRGWGNVAGRNLAFWDDGFKSGRDVSP